MALYPLFASFAQDTRITSETNPTYTQPAQSPTLKDLNSKRDRAQTSLDRWNAAYIAALILAVVLAVLAGLSQSMTIARSKDLVGIQSKIERENDRLLQVQLSNRDSRIAELNEKAGELNQRAGEAIERAGKAESHLAEANERAAVARREAEQASAKAEGFRLDIARANGRAAEANRLAEQERLGRLQLEARLADRVLTPDQQRRLTSTLIPFKGKTVDVSVFGDTPEIVSFSGAVLNCLMQAGMLINTSNPMGGGSYARGVLVGIKPGSPPEFTRFADVFITILRESVGSGVGLWDFDKLVSGGSMAAVSQANGADKLGSAPIRLFIGSK